MIHLLSCLRISIFCWSTSWNWTACQIGGDHDQLSVGQATIWARKEACVMLMVAIIWPLLYFYIICDKLHSVFHSPSSICISMFFLFISLIFVCVCISPIVVNFDRLCVNLSDFIYHSRLPSRSRNVIRRNPVRSY